MCLMQYANNKGADQHLCCSLLRSCDMYTCYIQSFEILASFCSWAGWFECYLVENPRRHVFAWCGSIRVHMLEIANIYIEFTYIKGKVFINATLLILYCHIEVSNIWENSIICFGIWKCFISIEKWMICAATSILIHFNSILKRRSFGNKDTKKPPHDKTNSVTVLPAKTQISLGARPAWSESSLSSWRKRGSLATHWAHSEDCDQTGRMPRLIGVFVGGLATVFFMRQLIIWIQHESVHEQ